MGAGHRRRLRRGRTSRRLHVEEMSDVQIQSTPETKEVTNALIRRGKEWHGPDRSLADVASYRVTVETAEPDPRLRAQWPPLNRRQDSFPF